MEQILRDKIENLPVTNSIEIASEGKCILFGGTIEDSNYDKIGHYYAEQYFVHNEDKWYLVSTGGEIIELPDDEGPIYSDEFKFEEVPFDGVKEWFKI